jgi:hypothetical protein
MKKLNFLLIMCLMATMLSASVVKTVTTTVAGTLSTLITIDESTTVTDLTVTGPIDAQDFKFMRDNLTVIANLNLANANIVDYNGTNGTLSASTDYPANAVPNSAFLIGTQLVTTPGKASLISVVLPKSIVALADKAFNKCLNLTTCNIPSSVLTIGAMCFQNCNSLASATLPPNLVIIQNNTFQNCFKLTTIEIPSSVTTINGSAFIGCTGLTSFVMPSTVTSIGASLFSGCTGLKTAVMSSGLTTSGNSTFTGCISLTSVTLPSSITLIDQYSFKNCTALTAFVIPSTVTTLGQNCFLGCTALLSIEIPSSVTTMSLGLFMGCSSLATLTFQENTSGSIGGNQSYQDCGGLKEIYLYRKSVPSCQASFFQNVPVGNIKLYVPATSIVLYQADPFWKTFQSISVIPTTDLNALKGDDLKVYSTQSGLVVNSTVANELIEVYSILGVRVASARSQVGSTTIDLPKGDVYIVRMGGRTTKIHL